MSSKSKTSSSSLSKRDSAVEVDVCESKSTSRPHGSDRRWVTGLLSRDWTDVFVRSRLKKLYDWSHNQPTCYDQKWLQAVFDEIDRIWYCGRLLMFLRASYKKVVIEWVAEHEDNDVAGYVKEFDRRDTIVLRMNRGVFDVLSFDKNKGHTPRISRHPEEKGAASKESSGYHAGGLVCVSRLECFLHVMLHEVLHMFLTACDKRGYLSDDNHHGPRFHRLLFNWFRQTEHRHGLMEGFENHEDLADVKKKVKRGDDVEIMVDNKWYPAKVTSHSKSEVRASVQLAPLGKTVSMEVHIGLVRYPKK